MKNVFDALFELDANLSLYELSTLSLAIYEAQFFLPDAPQMSVIWAKIKEKKSRRTEAAIAKCLDRAVNHIYESGDRQILCSYYQGWLKCKPTAHDFIYVFAGKLYGNSGLTP